MENVLFKISFPAEFHSQTAVEAAMTINAQLAESGKTAEDIAHVTIRSHEACIRIIDKQGPLNDPADRDHCIQYMVAIPLLFGHLTAEDYEDAVAADPRIDSLRAKIVCVEDSQFTADYHDPAKRSIANALTVTLTDRTQLPEIVVEYPIGHRLRRTDGIPLLLGKFSGSLTRRFSPAAQQKILAASFDQAKLESTPVSDYVSLYVVCGRCYINAWYTSCWIR
jgi:2-methylcitrate dehydratase